MGILIDGLENKISKSGCLFFLAPKGSSSAVNISGFILDKEYIVRSRIKDGSSTYIEKIITFNNELNFQISDYGQGHVLMIKYVDDTTVSVDSVASGAYDIEGYFLLQESSGNLVKGETTFEDNVNIEKNLSAMNGEILLGKRDTTLPIKEINGAIGLSSVDNSKQLIDINFDAVGKTIVVRCENQGHGVMTLDINSFSGMADRTISIGVGMYASSYFLRFKQEEDRFRIYGTYQGTNSPTGKITKISFFSSDIVPAVKVSDNVTVGTDLTVLGKIKNLTIDGDVLIENGDVSVSGNLSVGGNIPAVWVKVNDPVFTVNSNNNMIYNFSNPSPFIFLENVAPIHREYLTSSERYYYSYYYKDKIILPLGTTMKIAFNIVDENLVPNGNTTNFNCTWDGETITIDYILDSLYSGTVGKLYYLSTPL